MTSETPQTQALLQQINEVLNKTNPRLPWVMSSDAVQQRQVLEQTRDYLLALQQNGTPESTIEPEAAPASAAAMEASAQQVLQAVVQEMNYLRSNMMQPLRSDVELLRVQRDALTQEIRQLEMQRQQYGLPQQHPQYLAEFLQAAMNQMQEKLLGQMTQLLAAHPEQLAGSQPAGLLEGSDAALSPLERLERLQMLQSQSDQLMLRLDTTLRTVFESLQRNVQSYQDSLEDGLGRMHGMGQQGEAVFGAFVNRLGQILGREASSFLQSPQARSVGEVSPKENRPSLPGQNPTAASRSDSQINQLWQELNALDQTMLRRAVPGEPVPFDAPSSSGVARQAELANLEELDRVLSQLDLSAVAEIDDEELVWLPEEQDFPFTPPDQTDPQTPQRKVETDPDGVGLRSAQVVSDQGTTDEDLESAIDLLNQVAAEIPIDTRRQATYEPGYAASYAADRSTEPEDAQSTAPSSDPTLIPHPDALYADEFYQPPASQPETSPATPTDSSFAAEKWVDSDSGELEQEELEQEDAADLNADLFAGLNEFQEPDLAPHPASIDRTSLPQTVESRLLQSPEVIQPPQDDLVDSLFDAFDSEESEAIDSEALDLEEAEAETEIETIAALTDLLPDDSPDSSPFFVEPPRLLDFTSEPASAQSGVDWLETEAAAAEDNLDSPHPLQQLSADWYQSEDAPPAEKTDWTLGEWQDSSPVEPESPPEGIEWSLSDIPSILLSQPFSGQMTDEDLLFVDGLLGDDAEEVSEEASESPSAETSSLAVDSAAAQSDAPDGALLDSTLEDWFSTVEAQPSVPPEAARNDSPNSAASSGSTRSTGFTLDQFATNVDPAADADEIDNLNAFTLDGLDSLFEGVPSIDTAPPPSATDTQRVTVDNVFEDWGSAASDPPVTEGDRPEPPAEKPSSLDTRQQKKKFRPGKSAD